MRPYEVGNFCRDQRELWPNN